MTSPANATFPGAHPTGAVVRVMLDALLGPVPETHRHASLTSFQADAVHTLRRIIAQRGGAVLADSVGLGKTHVALGIIRERVVDNGRVLVVAPSALLPHWRHHLPDHASVGLVSHTAMSRNGARVGTDVERLLVVVDEAHAFRNPATRRYNALANVATAADVLLITATPVNNSVHDFFHLVRLFARDGDFADVGAPSLLNAVELAASGSPDALRRIVLAVMVRRTREMIQRLYAPSHEAGMRVPHLERIRSVRYDFASAWLDEPGEIARRVGNLTFPAHAVAAAVPAELMQLGLLKRLESSPSAFRASIASHLRLLREFTDAANAGYLLDARSCRRLMPVIGDAVQLTMRGVALPPWPPQLDREALLARAGHDERVLSTILQRVDSATRDPKADALEQLLRNELAEDKVLVFTQFRETANALWRRLQTRERIALITGDCAYLGRSRSTRRTVIQRFAPRANGARAPAAREAVRVLVATDVLSEGLNLQDARAVVSYDLPWNPVRLAQRVGRIDRLGSPHTQIAAFAFMPDADVDDALGLVRRLRRKLRDIRTVGGDAPRFRSPATIVHDEELQQRERLRLIHPTLPAPAQSTLPVIAAIPVGTDRGGALFCIDDGVSAGLVFVPDRGPARIDSVLGWTILESAVTASGAAVLSGRAVRLRPKAVREWRRALEDPPRQVAGSSQRAARLLHAWAENASRDDPRALQQADIALGWLAQPQTPAAEKGIAAALRLPTSQERVRALCRLAVNGQTAPSRRKPRVVAALELVPDPA